MTLSPIQRAALQEAATHLLNEPTWIAEDGTIHTAKGIRSFKREARKRLYIVWATVAEALLRDPAQGVAELQESLRAAGCREKEVNQVQILHAMISRFLHSLRASADAYAHSARPRWRPSDD